jgi:muramoyltetrapeptide carboxypeptidase LdcA involved in peptidoglycan recycling
MPNSLKGSEFLKNNPAARADDLKTAFKNPDIKGIICAIGGDDTFKNLPFLLEDDQFITSVKNHPKLFMGYSDATVNHLMFYKLGLQAHYGPCLVVDFAELNNNMLPYTKSWIEKLFSNEKPIPIKSSPTWYIERETFDASQLGIPRTAKKEEHGYEVLKGSEKVTGQLLGGCIESLAELLVGSQRKEELEIARRYTIFPSSDEWKNKICFLETCEDKPTPQNLENMLLALEKTGMFKQINGMIIGKPQDEACYEEYKSIYLKVLNKYIFPIMYNLNFGHAHPRCILPYGATIEVDFDHKKISLLESLLR